MSTNLWKIWKAYEPIVSKHWGTFILMNIFMILTVVTKCVMPLWITNIVEAMQIGGPEGKGTALKLVWYVFWTLVAHNAVWLVYDWYIVTFEVNCMRDVDKQSFSDVQRQSAGFFENAFAGALVTSAKRMRHTLEFVTDSWVYSLGRSLVMMIITMGVFWMKNPWYGVIFFAWAVSYCVASYY